MIFAKSIWQEKRAKNLVNIRLQRASNERNIILYIRCARKGRKMNRLTEYVNADFQCNDRECRLSYCDRECGHYKHMIQKLAEYEDSEEQGLLLKLPCKVGTNIYIVNHWWIDQGYICGLAECDDVDCACFKVYEDPDTYTIVAFDEFGVTWFLTEEEAEAALKARKNDGHKTSNILIDEIHPEHAYEKQEDPQWQECKK